MAPNRRRSLLLVVALVALIALAAWPVLAASPSPDSTAATGSPAATPTATAVATPTATAVPTAQPTPTPQPKPAATSAPAATEKPGKGQGADKDKEDGVPVTVHGTVVATTNADGETEYTMASSGKILKLEAGPPWFFGDAYPLKPYVGKSVTIVGEQSPGSDEIDVVSVDGKVLRAPGKPPWAGGWKAVGKVHPGWSQEKADRFAAKAKARGVDCWPPGQCKVDGHPAAPKGSEAPGG